MAACNSLVREWLAEYKALPEAEVNTYANTVRNNSELLSALYNLLEGQLSQEVADPVCHQLFDFYRSGVLELQRFTLELVPTLILTYLSELSKQEKKNCSGIEACILGIYNLEARDEDGKPKVRNFTIPTPARPSVYHEPPSVDTLLLTETALHRFHNDEPVTVTIPPPPQVACITASNRLSVMTSVVRRYNNDLASLSTPSHRSLCQAASKLSGTGFVNSLRVGWAAQDGLVITELGSSYNSSPASTRSSSSSRPHSVKFRDDSRIPLTSALLLELLNGVYFVMFNGFPVEGVQALNDIHQRASYEMYADVLLVTNAIRNSLRFNPSGQPQDGPMGISIAISPSQTNPAVTKDAITNASFRTKKLPDDIPSPGTDDEDINDGRPEVAITITPPEGADKLQLRKEKHDSDKERGKGILSIKRRSSSRKENSNERKISERRKSVDKENQSRRGSKNSLIRQDSSGSRRSQESSRRPASGCESELGELLPRRRSSERSPPPDGTDAYRRLLNADDIEAVCDEESSISTETAENPPAYDDLHPVPETSTDTEKKSAAAIAALKISKPLKSIMKKSGEKSSKVSRRESDLSKKITESPKSPKHSVSMSAGLSYTAEGAVDPSMVQVQVVRSSSSRTIVDNLDGRNLHKRMGSGSDEGVANSKVLTNNGGAAHIPEDGTANQSKGLHMVGGASQEIRMNGSSSTNNNESTSGTHNTRL